MKLNIAAATLIPLATILVLHSTVHAQPPRNPSGTASTARNKPRGKALYAQEWRRATAAS